MILQITFKMPHVSAADLALLRWPLHPAAPQIEEPHRRLLLSLRLPHVAADSGPPSHHHAHPCWFLMPCRVARIRCPLKPFKNNEPNVLKSSEGEEENLIFPYPGGYPWGPSWGYPGGIPVDSQSTLNQFWVELQQKITKSEPNILAFSAGESP